jgi:hypothetical protein
MAKRIRIEKWDLYYRFVSMSMFSFWMGYVLGGSSSWDAEPGVMNMVVTNGITIFISLFIIYILVKIILYYYRKLEITKRKLNSRN